MQRDMDLIRLILLEIEEKYQNSTIVGLKVDGYEMDNIVNHCKMLYEKNLIESLNVDYADNRIWMFSVGNLTWEGYDYLDKVRDDSMWGKIKRAIKEKGEALSIDSVISINISLI